MIFYQGTTNLNLFPKPKSNIVSLVPSISWYLYELIDSNSIVGISKFCEIPETVNSIPIRIGGTKNPQLQRIRQIKPDLIVANREENTKDAIEDLAKEFDVYLTDVNDLPSMYQMMRELGMLCGQFSVADNWVFKITEAHKKYIIEVQNEKPLRIVYLIWKDPYMAAGNNTFINSLLRDTGFINCFGHLDRYPIVSIEMIQQVNPDFIFLSSEPYPFSNKHFDEFKKASCVLVDGKMFSWYGSFLYKSFDYLKALKGTLNSI
ncbi:MAG: ABC transporter substrate-binding protein [Saprospiraceae bacterium]|nr:ABC transporter substrate-binding protein [Saprospiraceae bacterium]MBK7736816.1 ABC transporter substrate-binding protein [Saprospiraceae bacterium]MBK7914589.1 ABC transporter substrate-binding protein [Saprospiraceae bacterium]